MKIKEIAKLAKRTGTLTLFERETGCQWVGVGGAAYPLHGLPELTTDSLPRVLDLSDKEMEKITLTEGMMPETYDVSDYASDNEPLAEPPLTLGVADKIFYPVLTSRGLMFYDPIYLRPVGREETAMYERETPEGQIYFAAQHGTFLQAVIMPLKPDAKDLYKRLSEMRLSLAKLIEQDEREPMAREDDNYSIDPETGEVIA